ncbi:SLAC1 anion channel family protein [Thiomicrorhabdus sp. ZW0627]|uniref:SLAC1 anion channel family protein n=1 Tax=Thiomicrorhabdus sp. ZW0627 TaxID=3039774 RepID=UPI002436538B|nr:SLAC1 anion channel family protein [Thiomicrorhabdus sp. ZW0627]MDG6772965.1 SLAC1 anion channel family protein [Thiomicrorhabdus sp. ZW0627]
MNQANSGLQKLQYFPASFFGMVMGIAGLSIAFMKSGSVIEWGPATGQYLLMFTAVLFAVLLASYLYKVLRFKDAFWAEMKHPVKMNFIPTISISLLLLSVGFWELEQVKTSFNLWLLGASLQLVLTLWLLYSWIYHDLFKIEHSNPAWFIPIVGNIIVPIAGVQHVPGDISWFFFAIGIVFWPLLKAVLLYRLIFHPPLPEKLMPTLFIFIAPPAVGCISYLTLNHWEVDAFARILYFFALFFTLFLLFSINKFRKLSFALSWWAYTFPLAAMAISSFMMGTALHSTGYQWIGAVIMVGLVVMIGWLFYKTSLGVINNKICTPDN